MDYNKLLDAVNRGKSVRAIALEEGIGATTVRYWLKKHGLQTLKARDNRWGDVERLRELASSCSSKREILIALGMRDTGSIYTTLANIANEHGIELPAGGGRTRARLSNAEVFVAGRPSKGNILRKRMVEDLGIPELCDICKLGPVWQGSPIVLEVDHITGDHLDNRIANLRLLCPNCHSQQETNSRKKK